MSRSSSHNRLAAQPQPRGALESQVALLTGGGDRPYALGLAMALASKGVALDFIGSDQLETLELRLRPEVHFLNLRGDQRTDVGLIRKIARVSLYYARLIRYASTAKPQLFHLLWNNKFELLDRTVLMLYYKLLGKKVVLTAHNVNAGQRDASDSVLNRLGLKVQYRLADHIFVHTAKMKDEMQRFFGVPGRAVTVIPLGINNAVPRTDLTPELAKERLGIGIGERAILFFGRIERYKGLEFLVAAFQRLAALRLDCRLVIAGQLGTDCEDYLDAIRKSIRGNGIQSRIIERIEFIPDEETEVYFKAADLLVLPYTQISQSGVLILGYSFGLPVVAADVGSFREDVVEGQTGFLFKPGDPVDLAATIERYFRSDLFRTLRSRRPEIIEHAHVRHSWDAVSRMTTAVYERLTRENLSQHGRPTIV